MKIFTALFLACCLEWSWKLVQGQGPGCSQASLPRNLTVKEGSPNGTHLLNISAFDDVELGNFTKSPPFIDLSNGSLYINATVNLDGNRDWCALLLDWSIYLRCKGNLWERVDIHITLTDDFPPEFNGKRDLLTAIPELSQIGTPVLEFEESDLRDRDCGANLGFGSNTLFQIEDGNEDGAFSIILQNGKTSVNRTLDYEQGDTRFFLNISLSDRFTSNQKSFTTAEIRIIDIDDNDPIFNHTSYELHVVENSNSSVGKWRPTHPPIAVHDPDKDTTTEDPLQISLYDVKDCGVLKVNKTTGEICLSRTFDRELNQSLHVVLKVQQTVNAWRSSTVTLTLVIEDINDNRPQFQPNKYDVTIAEHSPPGTAVALITATDKDIGANAVFSYTLLDSWNMVFALSTQKLGEERYYGLLQVNSSLLLDREVSAQIKVKIGTKEESATEGPNCSGDRCFASVTVHLQDINDNSPSFDSDSYVVTLDHFTPNVIITKVTATDADQGPNANVTYELRPFSNMGCDDIFVHPITGDVRLGSTVTQSEACFVTVIACDNPLNIREQRCSSVPMRLTISNGTVVLQAPVPPDILIREKDTIQREMDSILHVTVTVGNIFPDLQDGSRLIISAKHETTKEPLPTAELQSLVDEKRAEIAALFDRYRQTTKPDEDTSDNDSRFTPLVIALIIVSIIFLFGFIVAFVFVYRFYKSGRRQQRLMQRLNGVNDLYINTANLSRAENGNLDHNATDGFDVTNPVFIDDSNDNSPRSGSLEGGEAEVCQSARLPDADSGVPSDRENGEDSDSSKGSTPVMRRSEGGSLSSRMGSAYLDAVLVTSGYDVSDSAKDMADVTAMTSSGFDVTGLEVESFDPPGDPEPDYQDARSYPAPEAIADPSAEECEEQENTITFTDSFEDLSLDQTPLPIPDSHNTELQPGGIGGHLAFEGEDDGAGIESKLAVLVKPSTPPMQHRSRESAKDEEKSPEEPEPDYAKKVRFNVQVAEKGEHSAEGIRNVGRGQRGDDGQDDPASPPEDTREFSACAEYATHPEESESEQPADTDLDNKSDFDVEEEVTAISG